MQRDLDVWLPEEKAFGEGIVRADISSEDPTAPRLEHENASSDHGDDRDVDTDDDNDDGMEDAPPSRQPSPQTRTLRAPVKIPTPAIYDDSKAVVKAKGEGGDKFLSSTATHSILDMQAYSPPRMLLQPGKALADYIPTAPTAEGEVGSPGKSVLEEGGSLAIGSPPRRAHRSRKKSPTKMAFDSEVAADDDSDDILRTIDAGGADDIMLNSPDRGVIPSRNTSAAKNTDPSKPNPRNRHEAKLMRTAGNGLEVKLANLSRIIC